MFKTLSSKDNAVAATYLYLRYIGAKVTEDTVEETLKYHPDYPSLLATSDALKEWDIENVSIKIKPEQLSELPTPFLTHLYTDGGIFALVKSIKADTIEWIHTKQGVKKEKIQDFLGKWDGVVLIAEANENSGEKNYKENKRKEFIENLRIPILWIGTSLLIIGLFLFSFTNDWHYDLLLISKLAGVTVSGLLLWQNIDKNNPFINSLCQAGGKTNCNAILSSDAAQVTSWLSWAEVGFFYFAGGFIALLINPSSIFLIWAVGATALTYTLWSVYYQAFIAKQWCTLCLSIQLLLIIEFLLNLQFLSALKFNFSSLTFKDIVVPVFGLAAVILIWLFFKPFLQKSQQVTPLKNDLKRFKKTPGLFLNLLHKQTEMPFVPLNMDTIVLGNPEAEHTLTMVTNPFCQPCARTHKIIEDLLSTNGNLNCQVIFSASNTDDDRRGVVARIILSLPKDQQAEALSKWYKNEERNIEKWKKNIGITENKSTEKIIEQHKIWCEVAEIKATPTLYLDDYQLPKLYRLPDLKGILKFLSTDLQIENKF